MPGRGRPSPDVDPALQTSSFPLVPPPTPATQQSPFLATGFWVKGSGQAYSGEEQRSKGPGIWHGRGLETQRETQELATGHFVHVMYYMGSGLQPENNLLFLLFPY